MNKTLRKIITILGAIALIIASIGVATAIQDGGSWPDGEDDTIGTFCEALNPASNWGQSKKLGISKEDFWRCKYVG